jgi:hypothetical protein
MNGVSRKEREGKKGRDVTRADRGLGFRIQGWMVPSFPTLDGEI